LWYSRLDLVICEYRLIRFDIVDWGI
jgi:hypothetical protein